MNSAQTIAALKRKVLCNLIAHSCSESTGYGLYAGNSGIILMLFELSKAQKNHPLNGYALHLFEKGLATLQKNGFSCTEDIPDPLVLGWIITEGCKRKYFEFDVEAGILPFEEYLSVSVKGTIAFHDMPAYINFIVNRYLAFEDRTSPKAVFFLNTLHTLLERIPDQYKCIQHADIAFLWIIYCMVAGNGIQDKRTDDYFGRILAFTNERQREGMPGDENIYALWRLLLLCENDIKLKDLKDRLCDLLVRTTGNGTLFHVGSLEKWAVTRCFFYPGIELKDSFYREYMLKLSVPELDKIINERMSMNKFDAQEGLCSLIMIL